MISRLTLEDDEEESINQLQRTFIEEERAQEQETSQSFLVQRGLSLK